MSTIEQALLSHLRVTTVHNLREFQALTEERALAAGLGTLQYSLRDPSRVTAKRALSVMANSTFGNCSFAYVSDICGKRSKTLAPHPLDICLTHPTRGSFSFRVHGDESEHRAGAGDLMLFQNEPGLQVETSDESSRLNLWLQGGRIASVLERLLDQDLREPLRFAPKKCGPDAASASLLRAVTYAAEELGDPGSLLNAGVGVPQFEEMLTLQLLYGMPHNYAEALARRRATRPAFGTRRAEAYMRAHLDRPITLADIAASANCSIRSLQSAFRSEHGHTVVGHLRDLRLDAARRDLLTGGNTVTTLARRYGFSNTGRFAAAYRERFGENPAETLGTRA